MIESEIKSKAFQAARLRSEVTRVLALLTAFGILMALALVRAGISFIGGQRSHVWPFAVVFALFTVYEAAWLRFVKGAIATGRHVSNRTWTAGIIIESFLPTIAIIIQIHTPAIGPQLALQSPAVLIYFVFIILSTLHLTPKLSRLAGIVSAVGYGAASVYTFFMFPEIATGHRLLVYGISESYVACLLVGGFAAGAVAQQIRLHVVAALQEAESQARIAQFEHDLGIARSIQQGILPKSPPDVDGFDIAGWNQPADETGGDYYDWQQLPDGCAAVTVADVTGHGIGSALCMSACRAYARAGFVIEPDLRTFISRLNRLLQEDLPTEKFVTFAAGRLDPREATLNLISAGHGPLLFYSFAEDSFRSYDAQGLPLGLLRNAPYGCPHVLKFAPGDIFLLVTDGFVEWMSAAEEDFGEGRLKDVIRANRSKPAAAIISELYAAVVKFAGSMPQLDDLTALVVKRV